MSPKCFFKCFLKHGFACVLLPSRDLTIFMDIEINPTGITGSPSISSISVRNINLLSTSVLASCYHTSVSYSRSELINLRPAYKQCFCKPILHRDSLKCVLLDGRELKSFEYSEWSVKLQCKTLRVIIVYRPPYSPQHQVSSSVFF